MTHSPLQRPNPLSTFSWIFYDFANTIYSMNVVSMYFSTWIVVDLAMGDKYVSVANSTSMILVALSMPVLGEISDRFRRKMPFLITLTLLCVLFTAGIGLAGRFIGGISTKLLLAMLCFIVANYSYQGGLVFYNALLPVVSTEKSMGRISGYGVAVGYLGAIIGLILVMPFNEGKIFGLNVPFIEGGGKVATFIPTAVLFLLFSLPTFFFVKDPQFLKGNLQVKINLKASFKKVWEGISNTRKYPGVARFLLAKYFYEDGIQTVIIFMAVYAQKVMGFSTEKTTQFFIAVIPSAIIGSAAFGLITDRIGPKKTLLLVIGAWVLCVAVLVSTQQQWIFWLLGCMIGVLMGSTWTSARPLLVSLVPKEMLGEFFGLYSLSGKLAAIGGPLIWAGVVEIFASKGDVFKYKAAAASLGVMMLIGLLLLTRVPDYWKRQSHQPLANEEL